MLKTTTSIINASQIAGVLPVANGGTGVTTSTGTGSTVLSAAPTLSGNVTLSTGNLIVASGQGIDFSATPGTGTSELLADYEEGTWTPILNSFTQVGVATATGRYTKIGNTVYIYCQIVAGTTIASIAGTSNITGLPFVVGKSGGCIINNVSTALSDGTGTIYEAGPIYLCSWAVTGQAHTIDGTYFV
jgi:hypothetical protein